jgi:hypothetical protein
LSPRINKRRLDFIFRIKRRLDLIFRIKRRLDLIFRINKRRLDLIFEPQDQQKEARFYISATG